MTTASDCPVIPVYGKKAAPRLDDPFYNGAAPITNQFGVFGVPVSGRFTVVVGCGGIGTG